MANRRYSCDSAPKTLEWMNAISEFLRPFTPLIHAHLVNFFKDRLWEILDQQWMECLRKEPVENLLNLPSGIVQDYWPDTLKGFLCTLRSLVLLREPESLENILPDFYVASLSTVLSQGMNPKKKHEVESLAAVVSAIANEVSAQTIVDVGSGQGYLAQALSFEYQLSVVAIDASLHHATVTNARAERIKKHYIAKSAGNKNFTMPQTITCRVLSSEMLTTISTTQLCQGNAEFSMEAANRSGVGIFENYKPLTREITLSHDFDKNSGLVLAGLHACGDLSVNMLRTFVECPRVKSLVSVGCCYNLLSEDCLGKTTDLCGFPVSNAAKSSNLKLGKNARDLACQSAERWKATTEIDALQNFDAHAFRAAFQMVLDKYYPETLKSMPSIGRQGKAQRRRRCRRHQLSKLNAEDHITSSALENHSDPAGRESLNAGEVTFEEYGKSSIQGIYQESPVQAPDKFVLFEEFSKSGLDRLGSCISKDIDLYSIWKENQHYSDLIAPFWSLRAALGPLVETYILLDRLLYLQEQGNTLEAWLSPLFDPALSPRNVAIIARRK